jgi:uncharacterized membrane protein SirB2
MPSARASFQKLLRESWIVLFLLQSGIILEYIEHFYNSFSWLHNKYNSLWVAIYTFFSIQATSRQNKLIKKKLNFKHMHY